MERITVHEEIDGVQRKGILTLKGVSFRLAAQGSKLAGVVGRRRDVCVEGKVCLSGDRACGRRWSRGVINSGNEDTYLGKG